MKVHATICLGNATYETKIINHPVKRWRMQNLHSLELQLQSIRRLLESSLVNNEPMVRITSLYSRLKQVELRVRGRRTLLYRKNSAN